MKRLNDESFSAYCKRRSEENKRVKMILQNGYKASRAGNFLVYPYSKKEFIVYENRREGSGGTVVGIN